MTKQQQSSHNMPFFSIIIASLNNIKSLQACIGTINAQDFLSYEVLISDGGSVDGTRAFLEKKYIRNLSWCKSESDGGIYHALNSALCEAKGQWILVLGSDDKLCDQNALARACAAISASDIKCDLFYSNLFIRSSQSVRLKKYPEFDVFCRKFSGAPFIHHQSAFISHEAVKRNGLFDTSYLIHSDFHFMLRVIKDRPAVKINDAFVEYDASGYSARLKNLIKSIKEVVSIRRNMGFSIFNLRLAAVYFRQLLRVIFRGLTNG